jgi:nucleoid-associated protein YgaU
LDATVIVALVPDWDALRRGLSAPTDWVDRAGPDRVTAQLTGALLWIVALWLAAALATSLASAAPGHMGAISRVIAARLVPAVLTRGVATAIGLSVVMTPVAAGAASSRAANAQLHVSAPAPAWPSDSPSAAPIPLPPPALPSDIPPATPTRPPSPAVTTPSSAAATVVVEPGDSLWLIAAHRLGPDASPTQIDEEWRAWYSTNEATIGADPGLLHPGTVLDAPDPTDRTGR